MFRGEYRYKLSVNNIHISSASISIYIYMGYI